MLTREKILKLFLEGKTQKEILAEFEGSDEPKGKRKAKKLKTMITESAFLSPKNFKYGSILVFFVAYLSPVFAVYMRGYEYESLLRPIGVLSLILSLPFFVFAIFLYFAKDLRRIRDYGFAFLVYYVVYLLVFVAIAVDIHVWTIVLFPLVIFPTMLIEWFKLRALIGEIGRTVGN